MAGRKRPQKAKSQRSFLGRTRKPAKVSGRPLRPRVEHISKLYPCRTAPCGTGLDLRRLAERTRRTKRARPRHGLAPESVLGLLPSIALSSAPVSSIVSIALRMGNGSIVRPRFNPSHGMAESRQILGVAGGQAPRLSPTTIPELQISGSYPKGMLSVQRAAAAERSSDKWPR